jgi:hypothetical protein
MVARVLEEGNTHLSIHYRNRRKVRFINFAEKKFKPFSVKNIRPRRNVQAKQESYEED